MGEERSPQPHPSPRRQFLGRSLASLGSLGSPASIALLDLLAREQAVAGAADEGFGPRAPHFRPRAKHVIFLFMGGGPSQFELFDYKPLLERLHGQTVPESFRATDQRFAFIRRSAGLYGPRFRFARHGACGATLSELLPHTAAVVDELVFIRSMTHDVFNHAPAQLYLNSSSRQADRPCMGAWVLYGLGSEAENLPGFVVLQAGLAPDAGN